MTDGFVTIVVEGDAEEATTAIADVEGVTAAHRVRGQADVVAELELAEPDDLQRVVTGEIQSVAGVETTTTLVTPELAAHQTPETERVTSS